MTTPTAVLIHGAFADASSYRPGTRGIHECRDDSAAAVDAVTPVRGDAAVIKHSHRLLDNLTSAERRAVEACFTTWTSEICSTLLPSPKSNHSLGRLSDARSPSRPSDHRYRPSNATGVSRCSTADSALSYSPMAVCCCCSTRGSVYGQSRTPKPSSRPALACYGVTCTPEAAAARTRPSQDFSARYDRGIPASTSPKPPVDRFWRWSCRAIVRCSRARRWARFYRLPSLQGLRDTMRALIFTADDVCRGLRCASDCAPQPDVGKTLGDALNGASA
jgi:hypothetical protein